MNSTGILPVEDEFITCMDLENVLSEMWYDIPAVADNGEDAIAIAEELRPDAVIMDITLRGRMTGIEEAAGTNKKLGIPVIFLTAYPDDRTFEEAIRSEPFVYIIKPFEPLNLKTTIEMALFRHIMEQFQILNDQIRAPLQTIMLYLSLGDYRYRAQIEEQLKNIDALVSRFDTGWPESEKVRSFLLRHYSSVSHGESPDCRENIT